MELVRVTEAAALASGRWMGRGDKEGADQAAVDAMRIVLQSVPMDGVVVIGEGEKDKAPMLFNGEHIGDGTPPMTDVAVDPIDGTSLTAQGRGGALAVIAVSERGSMFDPGPVRLHGEDRRRPRGGRGDRRHGDTCAEPRRHRPREGRGGQRPHRRRPGPPETPRAHRQGARHRCPHHPHRRRRRRRVRSRPPGTSPGSTC